MIVTMCIKEEKPWNLAVVAIYPVEVVCGQTPWYAPD
jgi:hypothetical protein